MKNLKKITLGLLGATILSLGLYACSNDEQATTSNTSTEQNVMAAKDYGFINMNLPAQIRSFDSEFDLIVEDVIYKNNEGKETEGQIRFKIPHNDLKIISIELSQNLLEASQINQEFFIENSESLLKAYGDPEKDKETPTSGDDKTHGERLKYCYDNFPKKEGRGNCVAGEWVSTIGKAFTGLFIKKN